MAIKHVIHHTYELTLTPSRKKALRFSSKIAAKQFAAAVSTDIHIAKPVPAQRSNSYDSTNNYKIQIGDMYVLHYRLIIDRFSLQVKDD